MAQEERTAEFTLTFRVGSEEYSKTYSLSEIRALVDKGESPFARNIACALCCAKRAGSGACYARCLDDGQCCDGGTDNCRPA